MASTIPSENRIRAREQATDEVRAALEIVTFLDCATAPFGPHRRSSANIEGEGPTGHTNIVTRSETLRSSSSTNDPTRFPIIVDRTRLRQWQEIGLDSLSRTLLNDQSKRSELEESILRSIHWLFISRSQSDLATTLVSISTSIEILLGPDDRQHISRTIGENLAMVLEEDYGRRIALQSSFAKLYDLRSGAVHGSQRKSVDQYDISHLEYFATSLITKLLGVKSDIQNRKGVVEWLNRSKLSGKLASPGSLRSITELRESRSWTQVDFACQMSVDPDILNVWEKSQPDLIGIRKCAEHFGVPMETIRLLPQSRLVNIRGHVFLLSASQASGGRWKAKIDGWDFQDAEGWPVRPIDPQEPESNSPSYIMSVWFELGDTAREALTLLASRLEDTMTQALDITRQPEDRVG